MDVFFPGDPNVERVKVIDVSLAFKSWNEKKTAFLCVEYSRKLAKLQPIVSGSSFETYFISNRYTFCIYVRLWTAPKTICQRIKIHYAQY